jgi:hypothetical protein
MAFVCVAACDDAAAGSPDGGASAGANGAGDGDGDGDGAGTGGDGDGAGTGGDGDGDGAGTGGGGAGTGGDGDDIARDEDYESGELGDVDPGTGRKCLSSTTSVELPREASALDLVFAIKRSNSMVDQQVQLAAELPRLVRALTSGDADGDGVQDYAPATDLHIGVVSTDLGLSGINNIPNCSGLGDDGMLHNTTSPEAEGCSEQTYEPRFLSYAPGDDAEQVGADLACLAQIGTDGCHFTQPLESLLKAVWPADDQRVWFLPDPAGFGSTGQGGPSGANGDIVRDGFLGDSLLGFVVITDDDDCSSGNTSHLRPDDGTLGADNPLKQQGLNTRCFFESLLDRDPSQPELQNNLYAPSRYVQTLRALRDGRPDRVVFAAIAGVPAERVSPEALADVDFESQLATDAFYDSIQADERMLQRVDNRGTPEVADDMLEASCDADVGFEAHPPTRLVEVVRGFGKHGLLQSMCEPDLGPAIDALIHKLGEHLSAPCIVRAHAREEDGSITCDVFWELPMASDAAGAIAACEDRPFLKPAGLSSRGGQRCKVAQRVVQDEAAVPGEGDPQGWYYDDFSIAARACADNDQSRIAFTDGAQPPPGATASLRCLRTHAEQSPVPACLPGPEVASADHVGDPCLTHVVPEFGFEASDAYVEPVSDSCGGAACIVYHLGGDPSDDCIEQPAELMCATPDEIEERVYCSCRCDGPEGLPTCACPDDYSCVPFIQTGPLNGQGSYCVRNGSVAR